jgi:hypothetical protein
MNLKVASEYYVDGSTLKKELDGAPWTVGSCMSPGDPVKMKIPVLQGRGGIWSSEFLANSQVMSMLLVQGSHLE